MKQLLLLIILLKVSSGWAQDCTSDFILSTSETPCVGSQITYTVKGPLGLDFTVDWDFADKTSGQSGKSVTHTITSSSNGGSGFTVTGTVKVTKAGAGYTVGTTCVVRVFVPAFCIIIPVTPPVPPGNPFLEGKEGNWRVKRVFILQSERNQTRAGANDNVNLRIDGTYKNFFTFWVPASTSGNTWQKQNSDKWTFKTQINHYNPFGSFELENVDPLNRFSAAIYGYNYTLPVAVAGNSRFREVGFDSFEDYDFGRCANNHFSFQFSDGIENKIVETSSHCGRRSIRLAPGEVVIMKKQFAECEDEETPSVVR